MLGSYHLMPGSSLTFTPRPGLTLLGSSGACVKFDTGDKGLIIMVTPLDPVGAIVHIEGWDEYKGISVIQHPHPSPFGTTWDIIHNLTPYPRVGGPVWFQPVDEIALVGAPNSATLLLNDCGQPSAVTDYVHTHAAYEPIPLQEQAVRAYGSAAIEAAIASIPIHFGLENITNLFAAGISFAHRYPTIVKWALQRTQYLYPIWDGSGAFMKENLDTLEAILEEHASEWEGKRTEGEEPPDLVDLPGPLKQQLGDIMRGMNLGEGDDGPAIV